MSPRKIAQCDGERWLLEREERREPRGKVMARRDSGERKEKEKRRGDALAETEVSESGSAMQIHNSHQ